MEGTHPEPLRRQCLASVLDTSLSGIRVVRELDQLCALYGRPLLIVSDNGTELTSRAVLSWVEETGIERHYIAPGKPAQNAFGKSLSFPKIPSGLESHCKPESSH